MLRSYHGVWGGSQALSISFPSVQIPARGTIANLGMRSAFPIFPFPLTYFSAFINAINCLGFPFLCNALRAEKDGVRFVMHIEI